MTQLDNYREMAFQLGGGWYGLFVRLVAFVGKWAIIATVFWLVYRTVM